MYSFTMASSAHALSFFKFDIAFSIKTTLLTGQSGVTVVASLPTNQSRDVTANIPIS